MQEKTIMCPDVLNVLDFDKTVTIEHTSKNPEDFFPETNTKTGLGELVKHNNKQLCAIATFHKDPNYVLTYLLPLLGHSQDDIIKQDIIDYEHHQLMQVYLQGCKYPINIGTPHAKDYNDHLRSLGAQGKNTIIKSITDNMPACYSYHFYDDTEQWCIAASEFLRDFHTHHVEGDNPVFKIKTTTPPLPMEQLQTILKAYLAESKKEQESEEKIMESSTNFSFFAPSSSEKEFCSEGKQESMQILAINSLLNFLDFKATIDTDVLESLNEGKLGTLIKEWQSSTGCNLVNEIKEKLRGRTETTAREDDYFSDDGNYEDVSGLKLN